MKKKGILITVLLAFSLVTFSGCGFVADGPFGWVYTNSTVPIAMGSAKAGPKTGKACIHSFFGAITIGDGGIEAAMRNGEINEVYIINKDNFNILGSYTRQCTVVKGE